MRRYCLSRLSPKKLRALSARIPPSIVHRPSFITDVIEVKIVELPETLPPDERFNMMYRLGS
jgi:hypothetical protein